MHHAPGRVGLHSQLIGSGRRRLETVANRAVKVVGSSSAVDGAKADHLPGALDSPALPRSLHSHLEHAAMRAFDDA